MSVDVRSLLVAKSEKKKSRLVMKDINRDLITSLLAIPVYGKEARDEEILSIIINAGAAEISETVTKMRERYNELLNAKKVKKHKDGSIRDNEGFLLLVPRD